MLENFALIKEKILWLNSPIFTLDGVYTTSSSAIMTMNEHKFSHSIEKPNALFFASVAAMAFASGLSASSVLSVVVIGFPAVAAAAAALFRPNDQLIEKMSLFNDNDYSKYDFSEFDN